MNHTTETIATLDMSLAPLGRGRDRWTCRAGRREGQRSMWPVPVVMLHEDVGDLCVARTASCFRISRLRSGAVGWFQRHHVMKQGRVMLEFLFSVLAALRVFVCSRSDTALEVLAL